MADVVLRVGGQEYSGWEEIEAVLSIESASGGFSLTVSDANTDISTWEIADGDECELLLKGEVIVTGYIDRIETDIDSTSHSIRVSGRDKAGDLVDCAAVIPGGEVRGQDLLQIAQMVAKPFGVTVSTDTDLSGGPFKKTSLQPGDSAWQFIENLGRQRGVLTVSDGNGGLLLTTPGKNRAETALIMGENILSARATADSSGRFSEYIVKGQSIPTDDVGDDVAVRVMAKSKDAGVKRYRPKLVMCEGAADQNSAQRRAKWEATVAAGRAVTLALTVQGWEKFPDGGVWKPNHIAPVSIPMMNVSEDLLIVTVKFSLSSRGTLTELTMARSDAYQIEPYDKRQKKGKVTSGIPNVPLGPEGVPQ